MADTQPEERLTGRTGVRQPGDAWSVPMADLLLVAESSAPMVEQPPVDVLSDGMEAALPEVVLWDPMAGKLPVALSADPMAEARQGVSCGDRMEVMLPDLCMFPLPHGIIMAL